MDKCTLIISLWIFLAAVWAALAFKYKWEISKMRRELVRKEEALALLRRKSP